MSVKPKDETCEETISLLYDDELLSRIELIPLWENTSFVLEKEYDLKFKILNKTYRENSACIFLQVEDNQRVTHDLIIKEIKIHKFSPNTFSIKYIPHDISETMLRFFVWKNEHELKSLCPNFNINIRIVNTQN